MGEGVITVTRWMFSGGSGLANKWRGGMMQGGVMGEGAAWSGVGTGRQLRREGDILFRHKVGRECFRHEVGLPHVQWAFWQQRRVGGCPHQALCAVRAAQQH